MSLKSKQKALWIAIALTGFITSSYAQNFSGPALVQQYGCLNCHNTDQKLVGPAYKAVSEKYQGDTNSAVNTLAQKIKAGGAGNWGRIPMPPHPNVSDEDAKTMVTWILSLK